MKVEQAQERRVIELVQRLVTALDGLSERDGDDDQRITKRYAHFVRNILGPHITTLRAGTSTNAPPMEPSVSTCTESLTGAFSITPNDAGPVPFHEVPRDTPQSGETYSVQGTDLPAIIISNSWDDMSFNSNPTVPIPPILGFSDSEYLAAMMSFPDQSWLM